MTPAEKAQLTSELLDSVFGKDGKYRNVSLRTIFDSKSHEWSQTAMAEKVEMVEMIFAKPFMMDMLIMDYQKMRREQNRLDILDEMPIGLARILEYILAQKLAK